MRAITELSRSSLLSDLWARGSKVHTRRPACDFTLFRPVRSSNDDPVPAQVGRLTNRACPPRGRRGSPPLAWLRVSYASASHEVGRVDVYTHAEQLRGRLWRGSVESVGAAVAFCKAHEVDLAAGAAGGDLPDAVASAPGASESAGHGRRRYLRQHNSRPEAVPVGVEGCEFHSDD
jgi:hypothetical protein